MTAELKTFAQKFGDFIANERRALRLLIVAGILARVVVHFSTSGIIWPDSFAYYRSAALMARDHNFLWHEIYRTPGYPFFLAIFLASFGLNPLAGFLAIAAQRALGVIASVYLYRILDRLFGRAVAFFAALLFSLNTVQLYYESVVQTEALFVFGLIFFVHHFLHFLQDGSRAGSLRSGLLLGLLTLVRPIAQLMIVPVLLAIFLRCGFSRAGMRAAWPCLLAFVLTLLPWCLVNLSVYRFFGVSMDRGINLFHRVIDIDGLNAPVETKYKAIRNIVSAAQAKKRGCYFEVHRHLRAKMRRGARKTDIIMKEFALEALWTKPWTFPAGTIRTYYDIFFNTRVSPHFCPAAGGPYLCSRSTKTLAFPAFPNSPPEGMGPFRRITKYYFKHFALPIGLVALFALAGLFAITRGRAWTVDRLFLLFLILYFTGVTAVFNRAEDRFRLPIDGFLFAFAIVGAAWLARAGYRRWRSTVRELP